MPVDLFPRLEASDVSVETPSIRTARSVDPAFEERWAAWVARGRQHELAFQRHLRVIAIAVAIVVALFAAAFRLFGGAL
jgi:hypothetical protein